MKSNALVLIMGLLALIAQAAPQGKNIAPLDPADQEKIRKVQELIEQSHDLIKAGNVNQAVVVLKQASEVEATRVSFSRAATFHLARAYMRKGHPTDALEAYRRLFKWDPSKRDLAAGAGVIHSSMEYAILLAKQGREEDAKAMYYYGLRNLNNHKQRSTEPAPFLVVFDPDPEGVYWAYTPERLEAAALMVQAMHSGTMDFPTRQQILPSEFIARVRNLTPDWFYPTIFEAFNMWNTPVGAQLRTEAQALAKPGLERQLVERFKEDLTAHQVAIAAADTPGASDSRPMTEGHERRSRMAVLVPNETVLKRLSVDGPG